MVADLCHGGIPEGAEDRCCVLVLSREAIGRENEGWCRTTSGATRHGSGSLNLEGVYFSVPTSGLRQQQSCTVVGEPGECHGLQYSQLSKRPSALGHSKYFGLDGVSQASDFKSRRFLPSLFNHSDDYPCQAFGAVSPRQPPPVPNRPVPWRWW